MRNRSLLALIFKRERMHAAEYFFIVHTLRAESAPRCKRPALKACHDCYIVHLCVLFLQFMCMRCQRAVRAESASHAM